MRWVLTFAGGVAVLLAVDALARRERLPGPVAHLMQAHALWFALGLVVAWAGKLTIGSWPSPAFTLAAGLATGWVGLSVGLRLDIRWFLARARTVLIFWAVAAGAWLSVAALVVLAVVALVGPRESNLTLAGLAPFVLMFGACCTVVHGLWESGDDPGSKARDRSRAFLREIALPWNGLPLLVAAGVLVVGQSHPSFVLGRIPVTGRIATIVEPVAIGISVGIIARYLTAETLPNSVLHYVLVCCVVLMAGLAAATGTSALASGLILGAWLGNATLRPVELRTAVAGLEEAAGAVVALTAGVGLGVVWRSVGADLAFVALLAAAAVSVRALAGLVGLNLAASITFQRAGVDRLALGFAFLPAGVLPLVIALDAAAQFHSLWAEKLLFVASVLWLVTELAAAIAPAHMAARPLGMKVGRPRTRRANVPLTWAPR